MAGQPRRDAGGPEWGGGKQEEVEQEQDWEGREEAAGDGRRVGGTSA